MLIIHVKKYTSPHQGVTKNSIIQDSYKYLAVFHQGSWKIVDGEGVRRDNKVTEGGFSGRFIKLHEKFDLTPRSIYSFAMVSMYVLSVCHGLAKCLVSICCKFLCIDL